MQYSLLLVVQRPWVQSELQVSIASLDEFHQGMLIQLGCTEVIDGVNNTFDKQLSLTSNDCSLVKMFLSQRESS